MVDISRTITLDHVRNAVLRPKPVYSASMPEK